MRLCFVLAAAVPVLLAGAPAWAQAPRAPTNLRVDGKVGPLNEPWPTGWDDPRFAAVQSGVYSWGENAEDFEIVTDSGEPMVGCDNFAVRRFRIRGREGIRVCGDNVLAEDGYIDVTGVGDDHADAVQGYGEAGMTNVVFRRISIKIRGAANAGIFFADHAAVDLTLEDVWVDATGAPNGAFFTANVPGDRGCNSLSLSNVVLIGGYRLSEGLANGGCTILRWDNVRDGNGNAIPRP